MRIQTVFAGSRYLVPMLVGQLLVAILVAVSMVLLIVPGIILSLGLLYWSYLVVDKQLGPVEAIKASWDLSKGHKMNSLLFVRISAVVDAVAGFVFCCVGGFL